jgi:peptidoglycan/xylan/chitin deacetylase (PgdA/CDA1 family)
VTLLLAYHRILADPPKENVHVLSELEFERQVRLMASSGIDICAPDEFESRAKAGDDSIGITFDDGFASDLRCAELLHANNMRAMFFVPTATIGAPEYMGVEDLRTLIRLGMKIGSHSHEHIQITPECAEYQANTSKQILEQHLGLPVEDFAFVGGVCNSDTIARVLGSGFKRVYTTQWGVNGDSQAASRVHARNCLVQGMTDAQFMELVTARNRTSRQALYLLKRMAGKCLSRKTYNRLQRWYVGRQGQDETSASR